MSAPKFIDELPPNRRGEARTPRTNRLLDALRSNPGQWAEVDRVPLDRRTRAAGKGSYYKRRHPDIETTTRQIGDEVVLYMRAVAR